MSQDTTLPPLPDFSAYENAFAAELEFHCLAYARAAIAAQAPQPATVKDSLTPQQALNELVDESERLGLYGGAQQAQEVPAEFLPVAVSSAPHHIWLDLGFDPYEEDAHFSNLHKPTWSEDNASGNGIKYVRADLLAAAPQAEPTQAQDTLSVVRRFERMVGDYNCLFTEYQGKAMPADVYQRFTALREERIPTARKELAALLAAAPQATHEANTHPEGAEQDELVERVMRSAQTLVLAVHFKRPKADQDALRNNLRMEMRAALAAPQAEPQPERGPLTPGDVHRIAKTTGAEHSVCNGYWPHRFALAVQSELADRWGIKLAGIGTKKENT